MIRQTHAVVVLAGILILSGGVRPSRAQDPRPERPYRGLFGAAGDLQQSLVGTGSLGVGYDSNVLAAALRSRRLARPGGSGGLVMGSAGLNYSVSRERFQVGSSVNSSARYYPVLSDEVLRTQTGSAGGSFKLTQKPAITVDQSVQYRPYSLLGALGDFDPLPTGEFEVPDTGNIPTLEQYWTYRGGLNLEQPVSRRVSVSTNYRYMKSDRDERHLLVQRAGAEVRYGFAKYASLVAGYRMSQGRYADGRTHRNQTPIIRIDASRPLSLTRRTTASVSGGSTLVQRSGQQRVVATGEASIAHEIGRTWALTGGYSRGFRYLETFDEPLFSDAGTVTFGGLVSQRLQVSTSVRAAKGYTGFVSERSYNTLNATAGLAFALSRNSSVNLTYAHYRYDLHRETVLPEGVLTDFSRHSIVAHVGFWVPFFTQQRRN